MNPLEIETHHVWSRVVQRAMLIGVDPLSNVDYAERREILRSILQFQAEIFAVDVGNYAILSSHFHADGGILGTGSAQNTIGTHNTRCVWWRIRAGSRANCGHLG